MVPQHTDLLDLQLQHVGWKAEHLRPYVRHVLARFGPDRLMFGSDWPVCKLAGTWKEVLAAFTQMIGPQSIEAREKLLGGTAATFYGLDLTRG